ncbi:bifunctional heptose 7-phosphate kinase/heptose 1-phosphate adenyltransferase [Luedemannella helvata]|uniref:Carbohydrate kinase PfkB domain-containing protein n=1 Tax=Luedemannella helvata TaxID=349315 RepID=A0ABP4W7C7_9ACTN
MSGPIVVVGDVLLDRDVTGVADRLCPDAPVPVLTELSSVERAGGAGLAASFLAHDGAEVVLIGAVGPDAAGQRVRGLLSAAGVELLPIGYDGTTPEKIRLRSGRHPLLRLDRGVTVGTYGDLPARASAALRAASAVLVSDYGRGVTGLAGLRRLLTEVTGRTPMVWDPHPRGATPVPGVRVACPNRGEAAGFAAAHGADLNGRPVPDPEAVAAQARLLRGAWRASAVAVTLGPGGALVVESYGAPASVPAPVSHHGDTCGAGDRFAATTALSLAGGVRVRDAVGAAVESASRYVASDGPANLISLFAHPEIAGSDTIAMEAAT